MNHARRKLLADAVAYERRLTTAEAKRLEDLSALFDQAHAREHVLHDHAQTLAAENLRIQLDGLAADLAELRHQSTTHMTVERFEREHRMLADRVEFQLAEVNEKIRAEERVTISSLSRDDTTKALLESAATNRRWMIGLAVGVVFSLLGVLLTLIGLSTHAIG